MKLLNMVEVLISNPEKKFTCNQMNIFGNTVIVDKFGNIVLEETQEPLQLTKIMLESDWLELSENSEITDEAEITDESPYKKELEALKKEVELLKHNAKYKRCPTCYGDGYIESAYGIDHKCSHCNGEGKVERRD